MSILLFPLGRRRHLLLVLLMVLLDLLVLNTLCWFLIDLGDHFGPAVAGAYLNYISGIPYCPYFREKSILLKIFPIFGFTHILPDF
jgi:hypothetical protein